jgi:hypothetical protein
MSLGRIASNPLNICFKALGLICRAGAECDFDACEITLAVDLPRLLPFIGLA